MLLNTFSYSQNSWLSLPHVTNQCFTHLLLLFVATGVLLMLSRPSYTLTVQQFPPIELNNTLLKHSQVLQSGDSTYALGSISDTLYQWWNLDTILTNQLFILYFRGNQFALGDNRLFPRDRFENSNFRHASYCRQDLFVNPDLFVFDRSSLDSVLLDVLNPDLLDRFSSKSKPFYTF